MTAKLTHLKRERASDSVFQVLRESIMTQVFLPGQRLNIKVLADRLGVSLTPIKDAINRLATEGLIEIYPRSGTYVTKIEADDVTETFELRAALECLAAEKAVEKITPQILERFQEFIDDLEKPVETEKERMFHERKNFEFHNLLVELSGNRKLIQMYQGLHAHIKIARIHYNRQEWPERVEQEKQEHRKIFEALQLRDPDQLVHALRQHILRSRQCLVEDVRKKSAAS